MKNDENCVIVGYSGHAYVVAEIALLSGKHIKGYVDTEEKLTNPFQLDYLGNNDYLENIKELNASLFIAIGKNAIREKLFVKNSNQFTFLTLIHPTAIISKLAHIDKATMVGANAIINPLASIGKAAIINTAAVIEHECTIHDFVHIAPGVVLAGNVTVGQGTFIGANTVVKQGITIGRNVTIGAGSVVIDDIPDNITIVGNPAKKILS